MGAPDRPGSVVAWWDSNQLRFGIVAGEEKQRIRLVLARGKEERVTPNRIVLEVDPPGVAPGKELEQRRQAGERVVAIEERVREAAGQVDVELLWQIVTEEETTGQIDLAELSGLALDSVHGDAQAALLCALLADGVHFARKGGVFSPRGGPEVEELRRQRERVADREAQTDSWHASLAAAVRGEPFHGTGSEVERRYIEALEQVALLEDSAPEAAISTTLTALRAANLRFDRPHEGAFRLLRRLGHFSSDDENLQRLRYRLPARFPEPVVAAAVRAAEAGPALGDRDDLTALSALTIDGPDTREIDDALSVEQLEEGWRLGIHIADPAAFIAPGDDVDREAFGRGLSHYHPDLRIPMLPAELSEQAASLMEGVDRPALSLIVELDPAGVVVNQRIRRSVIRSRARLDYDAVDRTIADGEGPFSDELRMLNEIGAARERARMREGALVMLAPEVDLKLGPDGRVRLERRRGDEASRRLVSEAMILAGALAAAHLSEQGVPTIFRRQAEPAGASGVPDEPLRGPVELRQGRRGLRRAESGLNPDRHFALGLPAYVQVTSPLRRFQDLVVGRQLQASLSGQPLPYDEASLREVLAATDPAEADARRAERAARTFWTLRYLEGLPQEPLEAVVVEVKPRPVVQLVETLWEQPMPGLTGVEPGEALQLRIERVNPRAGLLILRQLR